MGKLVFFICLNMKGSANYPEGFPREFSTPEEFQLELELFEKRKNQWGHSLIDSNIHDLTLYRVELWHDEEYIIEEWMGMEVLTFRKFEGIKSFAKKV